MRTLHFVILKTLKEHAIERLGGPTVKTKSLFPGMTERSFSSIKRKDIVQVNMCLSTVEKNSEGFVLHIIFSSKCLSNADAFCTEKGQLSMLEASAYKSLDNVSQIDEEVVDRYCGKSEKAPTTKISRSFTASGNQYSGAKFGLAGQ